MSTNELATTAANPSRSGMPTSGLLMSGGAADRGTRSLPRRGTTGEVCPLPMGISTSAADRKATGVPAHQGFVAAYVPGTTVWSPPS